MQVIGQLRNGYKSSDEDYIIVDPRVVLEAGEDELCFTDKEGYNMAWLNIGLPDHLRKSLMSILCTLFRDKVRWIDSELEGFLHLFECIQYTYYNRYATQVSPFLFSYDMTDKGYRATIVRQSMILTW